VYTLGINATYHDSAAHLVRDGVVVAAAWLNASGCLARKGP